MSGKNAVQMKKSLVRAVMVADDLTGACDAGAEFACAGLRTEISFAPQFSPDAEVLIVSTDSRRLPARAAFELVGERMRALPDAEIFFKKIDSTMRGNVYMECEAMRQATQSTLAVLAPALPAQGRIVERGTLRVSDLASSWSLHLGDLWRSQGGELIWSSVDQLAGHLHGSDGGAAYIACDAESDDDLARIAVALQSSPTRVLWIGSAGLAKHAAALLATGLAEVPSPAPLAVDERPTLFIVGSDHPVTQLQVEHLVQERACTRRKAVDHETIDFRAAGMKSTPLLVSVDMRHPDVDHLQRVLAQIPTEAFAGIILSGGDTAALVCQAAGVQQLRIEGRLQPGVAIGRLHGGLLSGMRAITKSGGFGSERCLVEANDFFSASARGRAFTQ